MGLIDNTSEEGHEKAVLQFVPRGLNSSDELRAGSLAVWAVVVALAVVGALWEITGAL